MLQNKDYKSHQMLSKIDEANYVKSMEQNIKMESQKKLENQKKKEQDIYTTKSILDQQIHQKTTHAEKIKNEEYSYADYVRKSVYDAETQKKIREEEQKRKMQEYNMSLQYQIQEQMKLKKYNNLMTEHEKKVNHREIEDYLKCGENSFSNLPGISANHTNHRIQHAPLNQKPSNPSEQNAIEKQNKSVIQTENQNYFNPEYIEMANRHSKYSSSPNKVKLVKKVQPNEKLLKLVEENMNDPLVEQKRNPTYNREYGYFNKAKYKHN